MSERTYDRRWLPILVAAMAALLVAGLGATITDLGPWYQSLEQPPWKPPDPAFGPAWTLIFALAAASAVTAWRHAENRETKEWIIGLFSLNGFLNLLWSGLFFRVQRPDWAFIEVVFLWASILLLIVFVRRISSTAAWLLAPYLVWVTFAAALNLAVVRLNGPF